MEERPVDAKSAPDHASTLGSISVYQMVWTYDSGTFTTWF